MLHGHGHSYTDTTHGSRQILQIHATCVSDTFWETTQLHDRSVCATLMSLFVTNSYVWILVTRTTITKTKSLYSKFVGSATWTLFFHSTLLRAISIVTWSINISFLIIYIQVLGLALFIAHYHHLSIFLFTHLCWPKDPLL